MGLFDQLAGAVGGMQQLQRMANGDGNYHDPNSQDVQAVSTAVQQAPPDVVQDAFSQAARQMDPGQYSEHVTPGVGGTNPLGSLSQGALSTIAGTLLSSLAGSRGGALGNLTQLIPGLGTTNPQQMSPQDVATMATYMQRNHPEAFGQATAQIGQQQPDLLHSLLGNKALMLGAAVLGAKILSDRAQARQGR